MPVAAEDSRTLRAGENSGASGGTMLDARDEAARLEPESSTIVPLDRAGRRLPDKSIGSSILPLGPRDVDA
jgi:hypothetical protein